MCVSGSLVLYYTHANRLLQPRPFTPSTTLDMCISKYTVSPLRQNQAPSRHHALTEWYITVPISQIDLNFNIAFEGVRVIKMFYQFCSVFGYPSFLDDSHSLACQMLGLCTHFYPGILGGYSPEMWLGVSVPPQETLALFQTKTCDFPYPISDLTQNFIP